MTTVALAGRRIDPPDAAQARFPPENIGLVAIRIARVLADLGAGRLVCSAACGADLLAIEAALELGLTEVCVVLPYAPGRFRASSVTDRPGPWGALFDRLLAAPAVKLIDLGLAEAGDAAYDAANERILSEAAKGPGPVTVCIVSEGAPRGGRDHSFALAEGGAARGWEVRTIPTRRV